MADLTPANRQLLESGPILLYDGECGLCQHTVQFVIRHESKKTLRFAALASPFGQALLASLQVPVDLDSVLWIRADGAGGARVQARSDAALAIAAYLDGPFRYALVLRLMPRPLRDLAYRVIARFRSRLLPQQCWVKTAELAPRFLD